MSALDNKPVKFALVTGAAGFLGRQLCRLLHDDGIKVRAVDRFAAEGPWCESLRLDLTEPASFDGLCDGIDTVFHLAAKTHATGSSAGDLADYQALNVVMTERLLAEAVSAGVERFLFSSSVKVIGEGQFEAQTEQSDLLPESAYGRTKLAAEQLIAKAGRESGMKTTILRMPLIYGPGVKGNLDSMIRSIARRRFPPLPDTGNRRSFVDARDVVRAMKLCSESQAAAGQTYLVTDGRPYSTFELVAYIRQSLGLSQPGWTLPDYLFRFMASMGDLVGKLGFPVVFDRSVYEKLLGSACYSSKAIEKDLGFRPDHNLEQSLLEMVEGFS